jgi:hypothetical protein
LEALECKDWATFYGLKSLPPYSERALYTWLVEALGEILWHGADAQTTLSHAQRKANAYVDCLKQSDDPQAAVEACFEEGEGEW